MLDSIIGEIKTLGKDLFKGFVGAPSDTTQTAVQQITGEEKSEAKIKEEAEKEAKLKKLAQSLHAQAQELGVSQDKAHTPSEEELKEQEEEEKKKKELPPLEVPQGKTTGQISVKRSQTQVEDKQGYKG